MLKSRLPVRLFVVAALMPAALGQQITVYSSGSLAIGQTRQLTAYVPLAVTTVNWSVNGVIGGNSIYGTVSTAGLYQAPMTVPATMRSRCKPPARRIASKFGTVTITVTQPPVQLWSISPTSVPVGPFHDFAQWGELRRQLRGELWRRAAGDDFGFVDRAESDRHCDGGSGGNEGSDHGDK